MIKLFDIPNHVIDTSKFSNLIFDKVVTEFEEAFAKYVGAKYAVAVNSATNAIFLSLKSLGKPVTCSIPSLITTRFLNAIEMAGCKYKFTDVTNWVGSNYWLSYEHDSIIIDSAQEVEPGSCARFHKGVLVIYSFYPTKPVGGICGGMIVSNDKERIDWIRQAAHFGEKLSENTNSWESSTDFKGYQMFMGTIPAYVAFENFKRYDEKRARLAYIADRYSAALNNVVTNKSKHLFRIRTKNNDQFVKDMYKKDIVCGIHYKPAHLNKLYGSDEHLLMSEIDGREVVSIPFHEKLTDKEIDIVIKEVKKLT